MGAASMQNTAAGTGNMKIYLMEKDAADIGVPAENGEALTTLTGDKLLVGTNGFSGLIDQIYVINRPETSSTIAKVWWRGLHPVCCLWRCVTLGVVITSMLSIRSLPVRNTRVFVGLVRTLL